MSITCLPISGQSLSLLNFTAIPGIILPFWFTQTVGLSYVSTHVYPFNKNKFLYSLLFRKYTFFILYMYIK